jgi:shikimate kinase
MKVFLIGLPGSGKTTFGKSLAEKLKLPFLDLDAELERKEGQPVRKIFESKTENYFRQSESTLLKEFCGQAKDFVMSTGGGAPCFFDNMSLMNRSGHTIFLNPPIKEIVDRLMTTDLSDRPLLATADRGQLEVKIKSMLTERIPFYEQAQLVYHETSLSAEAVALKIKD